MTTGIRITKAGPGVSLQDLGRTGYQRYGVNVAGPMDPAAFATANRAILAAPGSTAIEVSLGGIEITAEGGPARVAIAGAPFEVALGGQPLPSKTVLTLEPGTPLQVRAGASGMWCYLAFGSPLVVPEKLGSVSTHMRTGLGGVDGRGLAPGDFLPLGEISSGSGPSLAISAPWLDSHAAPIRILPGPQDDYFSSEELERFLSETWTISNQSDRMGSFLDGTPLRHRDGFNIVSDGITMGAIQVPGSGRPLVLMADRQPTGGYPKIGTIIWSDLGRFAQLRPGQQLRFEAVSWDSAVAARSKLVSSISGELRLEPLRRTDFTSEFLLERNLVDGVWGDTETP